MNPAEFDALFGLYGDEAGKNGQVVEYEADPALRDFENVPLKEDIVSYFVREVQPYVEDAWINRGQVDEKDGGIGKVGYEINFNRVFFKYKPPRPLEEIDAELAEVEDSGLEWLGAIPEHWEMRRCANLFTEIDKRDEPDLPVLNVSLNTGVTVRKFSDDRIESVAADFATYKVARKGQLVFNKMRFWQGAAGIAPVDGLTSPDYTVAHIGPELMHEFIELLFRLPQFSDEVRRYSYGMVDDRLRLYWDEFKNMIIPVPPLKEQKDIVAYLSAEQVYTSSLKETPNRSIVLLKNRRSALISTAVTGQLELEALSA
jgi:hypothetical protein